MQEYKTNYFQVTALIDMINDGWKVQDVAEYQGYLNVYLTRNNGDEEWNFDLEIV